MKKIGDEKMTSSAKMVDDLPDPEEEAHAPDPFRESLEAADEVTSFLSAPEKKRKKLLFA